MITIDVINQLANAIYRAEGAEHTTHPYGIMLSHCNNPRQVCINTIIHCANDYHVSHVDRHFIYCLADRYCPPSCDLQGNINWKHNVIRILNLKQ
jgi:hypothetical protein